MPNGIKVWVWTNFSRNFTATIATKNDPINPTANNTYSLPEKEKLLLTRSSPDAASMVGIARRNENSTAVFLFAPTKSPPIILAAALETPGTIETD